VDEFVNENLESLVDANRFEDAFELAMYILKMVDGLNIDDSDGGCTMVADSCSEQLDTIISMADISIKRRFYEIVKAEVLKDSFDCLGEYLVDILTESFRDDEFIAENLEFADSMLKKYEAKTNDFSAEYNAIRWFNKYLFLMETAGRSDEERLAYCKNHWQLENAKDEAIKIYCKQGDYAKEAEVLKEYIAIEEKRWGRDVRYKQRLKEIYSITGDKENYIEMLWSLVTKSPTIELYNELKSCYTAEEWQKMREKVFSETKNKYYVAEFYVAEKLYDRLLDYVLSSDGFDSADRYSAVLGKLYPNEILEKYRVEIEKVAVHTMGREAYRGWVQILKKMRKINGGNEVVEEIARHWRVAYSNRRAMMEELDKLKK
jgi:hypothetical protein